MEKQQLLNILHSFQNQLQEAMFKGGDMPIETNWEGKYYANGDLGDIIDRVFINNKESDE